MRFLCNREHSPFSLLGALELLSFLRSCFLGPCGFYLFLLYSGGRRGAIFRAVRVVEP